MRITVVGAGMVGLSCAWSLQDYGVEVEVVDRAGVAAGASWGNAGYLAPALTVPLPEPTLLRYGLRAVASRRSPVRIGGADRDVARLLPVLVAHCTSRRWSQAMATYRWLNPQIISAFDRQMAGGSGGITTTTDIVSGFLRAEQSTGLLHELEAVVASGQAVGVDLLTGEEARSVAPQLSAAVVSAVRIRDQRFIDPVAYVSALAAAVRARGGRITEGQGVDAVAAMGGRVVVSGPQGTIDADGVVLANGAWLGALARPHGVTLPVAAGRGYSFSVPVDRPWAGPVHLPSARLAITPRGGGIRVAGLMEFDSPDAPLRRGRVETMVQAARPFLDGVDWDARSETWVGPRPLSGDGLPVVGATATPGVWVAGGHGMWGVTLGPLTGELLARQIVTGEVPPELAPLHPLRGRGAGRR